MGLLAVYLASCFQVIREMIKPPDSKWKQLFGGDAKLGRLSITAAEFRQLVPQKELQVRFCSLCKSTVLQQSHMGCVEWGSLSWLWSCLVAAELMQMTQGDASADQ